MLVAAMDCLWEGVVSVRRIDVDGRGLTFHYLFHKEQGLWTDLLPASTAPVHGMWYLLRNRHNGSRLLPERSHQITLEQARAVLSFPACPDWPIPEATLAQIGVRRNGAVSS